MKGSNPFAFFKFNLAKAAAGGFTPVKGGFVLIQRPRVWDIFQPRPPTSDLSGKAPKGGEWIGYPAKNGDRGVVKHPAPQPPVTTLASTSP